MPDPAHRWTIKRKKGLSSSYGPAEQAVIGPDTDWIEVVPVQHSLTQRLRDESAPDPGEGREQERVTLWRRHFSAGYTGWKEWPDPQQPLPSDCEVRDF